MKKIILLLSAAIGASAQNFPMHYSSFVGEDQLSKEDVVYSTGYNAKVDENILWALNKYWKFPSTVSTLAKPAKPLENKSTVSAISVDDYENSGDQGSFYNTQFRVYNKLENAGNKGITFVVFEIPFDNLMRKGKEKEGTLGSDKTMDLIADKALMYTMFYCAMVKNYARIEGGTMKKYKQADKTNTELNEKYKGATTVLIPLEILNTGLSKEAFAGLKFKYEFDSSENIAKRIKDGNVKNQSQLFFIKKDKSTDYAYIVDLESGDLVSWASVGAFGSGTYDYMDDKRAKKLLGKLY